MIRLVVKREYYNKVLKLALPIIVANLGQATVGIIDSIMVGRLGAVELAASSFASILITNVLVFGLGIAMSLTPLVGENYAKSNYKGVSKYFQNSIILNGVIGVVIAAFMILSTPLLSKMGQSSEVVEACSSYYIIVATSIIPYMLFMAFKHFMEGVGNTKVAMNITIASNVMNIILNYLLIYGVWFFPKMGIDGAAVATLISRIFMAIAFYVYTLNDNSKFRYLSMFSLKNFSLKSKKELLSVGIPISTQMVVEVLALSVTTIMVGWIGVEALAANQIIVSVMSFTFMVANGFAGALTIINSHEYGEKNWLNIKRYTIAGVEMSCAFMVVAALLFLFCGRYIAMIYSIDETVIDIATHIFVVTAALEIFDGYQVSILGALRGIQDVKIPMYIAIFTYIVVNVPIAYILGFYFDFGYVGVWCGFLIALIIASIMFTLRFKHTYKKAMSHI